MRKTFITGVLLGMLGIHFAGAGDLPKPPDVWKDYDPNKGDFKQEIVKEETKDGFYYRESYISAYVVGEEVRVYCLYKVKDGAKKAPGLLNVHGWMGAASIDNDYVNDGWAVMSYDYCGKSGNRVHYTKYPEKLAHGNMEGGKVTCSSLPDRTPITDPKQTSDYLWYALESRVLSYLEQQKEVDRTRLGAKGYSYGGTLMWYIGMDPRIKAIVAYFGIGWTEYYRNKQVMMYNTPYVEPKKTTGEEIYLAGIAPEAHVPYITAPTLFLNGSNDHHGVFERGLESFKMFKKGVPWSYAVQVRGHHNTEKIGQDCKMWLEKYVLNKDVFWPEHPKSEIKLDTDGIPELVVTPASPERVKNVEIYYSLKNPVWVSRAWRDAESVRKGNIWVSKLPVLNVDDYVFSYSNVIYDTSVVVSTDFNAAIPSKLGAAKATDKASEVIYSGDGGVGAWSNVAEVEGVGGIKGFRCTNNNAGLGTDRMSDPKWQAPVNGALGFKFYCTEPQTLIFTAGDYSGEIEITASDNWQEMVITKDKLFSRFNQKVSMPNWEKAGNISFKPKTGCDITKVIFAQFKWVVQKNKGMEPVKDGKHYLKIKDASKKDSFWRIMEDKSVDGNPISVGKKVYGHGLGVHAPSELEFPLDGKFGKFHVVPGPDDEHNGLLELKIFVDDKEVFASGPAKSGDGKPREPLNIPVTGAKTLKLIVTDGGDDKGGDHADWADAWLE